jgi:quercetin dioxygenase-like cupin family protein
MSCADEANLKEPMTTREVGVVTGVGTAHTVTAGQGRTVDLGVARMRVLANGDVTNGGAFTLAEFAGSAAGSWTVPHMHREMEESFYILEGRFTFTVGEQRIDAVTGTYLLVPRGTTHTFAAADGGGRLLLLMVPGGLERMFFELAELPPNSITDPAVRAAIAARYDSIPV